MFSICTDPLADHASELEKIDSLVNEIIIDKDAKKTILKRLWAMNINARTLFPGIDGLGKSLKEYCEIWHT